MQKKKVKFGQVAIRNVRPARKGRAEVTHLAAVDTKGRIWERFSDMDEGHWGQIDPPDEPEPTSKPRVRKR